MPLAALGLVSSIGLLAGDITAPGQVASIFHQGAAGVIAPRSPSGRRTRHRPGVGAGRIRQLEKIPRPRTPRLFRLSRRTKNRDLAEHQDDGSFHEHDDRAVLDGGGFDVAIDGAGRDGRKAVVIRVPLAQLDRHEEEVTAGSGNCRGCPDPVQFVIAPAPTGNVARRTWRQAPRTDRARNRAARTPRE